MEVHYEKVRGSIMYMSDFRREGILQRRMPQRLADRQVPLPSFGLPRPLNSDSSVPSRCRMDGDQSRGSTNGMANSMFDGRHDS